MLLAKPLGENPRELAVRIAAALAEDPEVEAAQVAGPGFINLRLKKSAWQGALRTLIAAGPDYGKSAVGRGEKINVEFVSANPTGPMHVGHARGAVFGDALASLLIAAGYAVFREYYINDAARRWTCSRAPPFFRYREALGEPVGTIGEGLYPGDYLKPVGEKLAADHGSVAAGADGSAVAAAGAADRGGRHDGDDPRRSRAARRAARSLLVGARTGDGGTDRVAEAIAWLADKGLIYEGKLPPPKGRLPEDWEDREQTLFSLHRLRRRRRPAAEEVGRQLHLLRLRYRLPLRQVPPRLPQHDRRARR